MIVDQSYFHEALRDPAAPIPAGLVDPQSDPAGRRFNVYRNNVTTSLMDALEDGYPVIKKLLGNENFRNLSREYQAAHPPTSPLMMFFGGPFADFLDGFKPLAKLPYLGDVARLKYGLRQSYHAADTTPIDPACLGNLSEQELLAARLTLAPSVKVITSKWPILGIWQFNTIDDAPKPEAKAQSVLITRAEFDPTPTKISHGDVEFLGAVSQGHTLGEALVSAQQLEPAHDFAALLGKLLNGNALTKLGDGVLGIFQPSVGAYAQIFPKVMESVVYDTSQLSAFHWLVVVAGTWAEFVLPALIVSGLLTRLSSLGMIAFIAVQSLTDLYGRGAIEHDGTLGAFFDRFPDAIILDQRAFWVFALLVLVIKGAGPLSLDRLLRGSQSSATSAT